MLIAFGALAAFSGCVSDFFADGRFACDPRGTAECPPGLVCASDGRCRTSEIAVTDAGTDVAAPIEDAASPPGDACASAAWTSQPAGRTTSALALAPDGRLYAGGTAAKRGWIAEVDTCDGGIVRETQFDVQGATEPTIQAMALLGEDLVVSGTTKREPVLDALYARFSTKDFKRVELVTKEGSGIIAVNWISVGKNNVVNLGGARNIFATTQTGWLMRVEAGAIKCEAFPGTSVSGFSNDAVTGQVVMLTPEADKTQRLSLLGDLGCATTTFGETLKLPTNAGGGNHIGGTLERPIVVGGTGPAPDGNETGFVAVREGTTWTVAPATDPNPGKIDIYLRVGFDGEALYVGGVQNATLTGGTPTLYRYDLPITTSSKTPTWTTNAFGGELAPIEAVIPAPKGTDGIYVAGTQLPNRTKSVIARCRKAEGCAK
jgi:hypothetical protein